MSPRLHLRGGEKACAHKVKKKEVENMMPIYHVFNKSIARYVIFNSHLDYIRMIEAMCYYRAAMPPVKFSWWKNEQPASDPLFHRVGGDRGQANWPSDIARLVDIIAYCLMPTHIHFVLRELGSGGVSRFINRLLNSYTRYFNVKYRRKGPLWQSRSKKVLLMHDNQLLHVTRYIHLNPVTAFLVEKPELWDSSSYREYTQADSTSEKICNLEGILALHPSSYKEFVESRIAYQRALSRIDHEV